MLVLAVRLACLPSCQLGSAAGAVGCVTVFLLGELVPGAVVGDRLLAGGAGPDDVVVVGDGVILQRVAEGFVGG